MLRKLIMLPVKVRSANDNPPGVKEVILQVIRRVCRVLRLDLTRNLKYDRETYEIMQRLLEPDSCCIDVGCHKGEIMDLILKFAPRGLHYGFEPIPAMAAALVEKYRSRNCIIYPIALSDQSGMADFHLVVNAPAFSGLQERKYQVEKPELKIIQVETDRLDHILDPGRKIDFIKIDVEGGEFGVLKGAVETINRNKPHIIFECGLGASDYYGTQPEAIFDFVTRDCGLQISLMEAWLKSKSALTKEAFCEQYRQGLNYYFLAHP